MKQGRFLWLILMSIICHASLYSYDDTPTCFKELETNFFEPNLVIKALVLHQGDVDYQNRWVPITNELRRRSQDVPAMIKDQSDHMSPSPLEYPFQPDVAAGLLWKTLFIIFKGVLNEYEIRTGIPEMFDYIRSQQEPRLKACLGEPKLLTSEA